MILVLDHAQRVAIGPILSIVAHPRFRIRGIINIAKITPLFLVSKT